jgi:hypothetical protein
MFCRSVVEDSHHFDEELHSDPDTDPQQSEKSDQDPLLSEKSDQDPDPHQMSQIRNTYFQAIHMSMHNAAYVIKMLLLSINNYANYTKFVVPGSNRTEKI